MSAGFGIERLAALWQDRHPSQGPVAHEFRTAFADRWVRFHSLPGSKRYPESESEYGTVLDRYNTVLDELFAGRDVYVVTVGWSPAPIGPGRPPERETLHPEGVRWFTVEDQDDPDPAFHTCTHLYADRRPWQRGCIDPLLRAVADDVLTEVFITDTELRRIHHPYDGGADTILASPEERDRMSDRHPDWLSGHASGL